MHVLSKGNYAMKNLRSETYINIAIVIALVVFVVAARTAPHPANFAPVAAVALFGGAVLPRRWAVVAPLLAMIASDLIIGLHPLVLFTWGSFALIALASSAWLKGMSPIKIGLSSIGASVFFYVVTNFGVWAQGKMYAMNMHGLIDCYINALPFFRGTLAGDLFYTGVLFSVYAFVAYVVRGRRGYARQVL